jgi:hypothetical protein
VFSKWEFWIHVGVGVVEESRLVKKADERIEMSLGEPGISDGDPTGDAGSSATLTSIKFDNYLK